MKSTTVRRVTIPGIDATEEISDAPHMGAFLRGEIHAGMWFSKVMSELRLALRSMGKSSESLHTTLAALLLEEREVYDAMDEDEKESMFRAGVFAEVTHEGRTGVSLSEEFVRVMLALRGAMIPLTMSYEESLE